MHNVLIFINMKYKKLVLLIKINKNRLTIILLCFHLINLFKILNKLIQEKTFLHEKD